MDSILARSFTRFPCLEEIREFLANDAELFQKSELYSSSVDAKIIDESLRKSLFRTFEDDELFSLVDNVVGWLNTSDPTFIYQLRRDNITETRYEAGGHFLKHKARLDDFLSITSNLVEEFTLIKELDPPEGKPLFTHMQVSWGLLLTLPQAVMCSSSRKISSMQ
eukprot:scaffold37569_cov40-Cyclotella_meneghiniana.AAC.1